MKPNQMFTVGLLPSKQLVSLITDDEGNWRDVPEIDGIQQTIVPLVKIQKPETGVWEPSLVWLDDCVERQWVPGIPLSTPTYTAEEWVQQYFSNLEVIALMRLEQSILMQGKTLGPKMEASKQWLESMLFAQPSSNFPAAPYSYSEISSEASQTLSGI